ncbi:hypothetical protein ACFLYR_06750 [Chloroflexota bacterium]
MKESYEKPQMVTEKVEIGTLVAGGTPAAAPLPQLVPFFGLCPPC